MIIGVLLGIILLYIATIAHFHYWYPELRWDWNKISTDDMSFPPGFVWGTATAAHQVEGNCENNWSEFEKTSQQFQSNVLILDF